MTGHAGVARRLLIRHARLLDGTGTPARPADLLVEGDRIAAVAAPDTIAARAPGAPKLLDATGLMVCPGFIDIHSHGDLVLALPPAPQRRLMAGRIAQGITTQIVGNCGLGVFPRTAQSEPLLRAVVDWMTPRVDAEQNPLADAWPWSDLAEYLGHLERQGVWINAGTLQPHGPMRMEVAGLSRVPNGMTQAEAAGVMSARLAQALEAGAFGMSTGLIYPPGLFTPTEELTALARVVARAAAGTGGPAPFVASHIRGSSGTLLEAVGELLEIGRAAGAPVQHSHSEAVGRGHWGKLETVLAMEERARQSGQSVSFDMFPYTAAATMMLAIYPPWALEGGIERLLARLADPATRTAIGKSIEQTADSMQVDGWPHNLVRAVGWEQITIGSVGSPAGPDLEGMSLAELGRARKTSPLHAISDLMIEQHGMVSQIIHGISGETSREEGLEMLLSHPSGCVCTDADDFGKGRPHPASHGAFPKVLGRYVRDAGLLSWEEAIHKMTGQPAALLGLRDRGVLRQGAFADLVLFDPDKVDGAASFDRPRRPAEGIACVMVNGSVLHADAGRAGWIEPDEGPAGRVLRRGG